MGRHNDKNIREVLNDFITASPKVARGYHATNMELVWREQMGSVISNYTKKVFFNNGILKIYLTSSPLKKELLMGRDKIIKLMNDAVGSEIVTEVEIF